MVYQITKLFYVLYVPAQKYTIPSHQRITYLNFTSADDNAIIDYLPFQFTAFEELSVHPSTDIETLWRKFKTAILHCVLKYIPCKVKTTRKQNPWISRDISHAKRKVKRIRKSLKFSPRPEVALPWLLDMKNKIKDAKSNFYSDTLTELLKSSPSKFWNYIKPKSSSDPSFSPSTSRDSTNSLNFFCSVFTADDGKTPENYATVKDKLSHLTVTKAGVLNLILNLDTEKVSGPDNILNAVLK